MKIINQNSKFIQVFAKVGNSWELDGQILSGVEEFTCRLYGFSRRIRKVDEAREIKVKKEAVVWCGGCGVVWYDVLRALALLRDFRTKLGNSEDQTATRGLTQTPATLTQNQTPIQNPSTLTQDETLALTQRPATLTQDQTPTQNSPTLTQDQTPTHRLTQKQRLGAAMDRVISVLQSHLFQTLLEYELKMQETVFETLSMSGKAEDLKKDKRREPKSNRPTSILHGAEQTGSTVCSNFSQLTTEQKSTWVKTNKKCWRCGRAHQASQCRLKTTCKKCKGRHLEALHEVNAKPAPDNSTSLVTKANYQDKDAITLLEEKNVRVEVEGTQRYATPLLRISDMSQLQAHKEAVLPRLRNTERHLAKDPEWAAAYREEIEKLEQAGYIVRVEQEELNNSELALDLRWFCHSDTLGYKCRLPGPQVRTMRNIYRVVASLYDPLGFIITFTTRAKILIQCLWNKARHWDDPALPKDTILMWTEWERELQHLSQISLPRCYVSTQMDSEACTRTVHIFCDVSERDYGAVTYLRSEGQHGQVELSFLTARSRVAPKKQQSMPRLELCVALSLASVPWHDSV
ncbi:hypothetical protein ACEWY4_013989 [Coilia grayii]|uniref:Reverse transcriptase RNase H-like domain-containing protein n=1 Tax=Coilia grayii TaxID=363190 RepID=A0ABD1JR16_9TELE